MKILGLDSSGLVASAALVSDGILTAEYTIHNKKTHSQTLMPMIAEMLSMAGTEPGELDAVAVSEGPGSFTGLRIGASIAKGLAWTLKIPIIPVSSLMGLAANVETPGQIVCPIMDARRGDVYNALYLDGKKITPDRAISLGSLLLELDGKKAVFVGDGVFVHKEKIIEKMGENAYFAPPIHTLSRASSVAYLAQKRCENNDFDDYHTILPIYIRTCQAEREYNERMKEFNNG